MVSFPAWGFFRPRKSPQLPKQTRLCQRVPTRQVSARQSQRDELIRSRTTSSTTEATTKVTNCHSNIVIQSEVKLDSTFKAGATRDHLSQWAKLTSDKFILSAVAGSTIEFDHLPTQCRLPLPLTFSAAEAGIVDEQIRNFLDLGIVEKTVHSCPEFVSIMLGAHLPTDADETV